MTVYTEDMGYSFKTTIETIETPTTLTIDNNCDIHTVLWDKVEDTHQLWHEKSMEEKHEKHEKHGQP